MYVVAGQLRHRLRQRTDLDFARDRDLALQDRVGQQLVRHVRMLDRDRRLRRQCRADPFVVTIELVRKLAQPLHDAELLVVLAENRHAQHRASFEAGHTDRRRLETLAQAAVVDVDDFTLVDAFAGEAVADRHTCGLVRGRRNHDEVAAVTIKQPKNTRLGNDRDLADLDNFTQEFRHGFRCRQPMHDLQYADQRLTRYLAVTFLFQRYRQTPCSFLVFVRQRLRANPRPRAFGRLFYCRQSSCY